MKVLILCCETTLGYLISNINHTMNFVCIKFCVFSPILPQIIRFNHLSCYDIYLVRSMYINNLFSFILTEFKSNFIQLNVVTICRSKIFISRYYPFETGVDLLLHLPILNISLLHWRLSPTPAL